MPDRSPDAAPEAKWWVRFTCGHENGPFYTTQHPFPGSLLSCRGCRCLQRVVDTWTVASADPAALVKLLHHIDGQLGLAVYRNEGSTKRWQQEASDLITRIRAAVKELEAHV